MPGGPLPPLDRGMNPPVESSERAEERAELSALVDDLWLEPTFQSGLEALFDLDEKQASAFEAVVLELGDEGDGRLLAERLQQLGVATDSGLQYSPGVLAFMYRKSQELGLSASDVVDVLEAAVRERSTTPGQGDPTQLRGPLLRLLRDRDDLDYRFAQSAMLPALVRADFSFELRAVARPPDSTSSPRLVPIVIGRLDLDEGEPLVFQLPDRALQQLRRALDDIDELGRLTIGSVGQAVVLRDYWKEVGEGDT
jgi:hypothetical protein